MLEAGQFSSVAPLMGGVIEENIVRNIIAYLDARQHNSWMSIGVGLSCAGVVALPQPHGALAIILGGIVAVIGDRRGK